MPQPIIYPFFKDSLGKLRPLIPIKIVNPHTSDSIITMALLDTGADACVFPKFIADRTKHNLKAEGVISNIQQGVGESKVECWKHTYVIHLLSPDRKSEIWKSKAILIDCLDHDNAPPLLGWDGFMKNFTFSFQYSLNRILIIPA